MYVNAVRCDIDHKAKYYKWQGAKSTMSEVDYTSLEAVSPVLTNAFLSQHLTSWFGKPLTFTHWEYVGETAKGDSFMSDLIRIKLFGKDDKGNPEEIQVILKSFPKSKCRKLTFRLDEFFKNEIQFYQYVLPEMLKFQAKKDLKDPFDNYTKMFAGYVDGENDILALEDVSLQNYGRPIRQDGIDYEHCKVTLKSLAKFHALSFAMKDQVPENFQRMLEYVSETYYKRETWGWHERFWKRVCGIAIDAVEKEYPDSIYLEKVKEFASPKTHPKLWDATTNTLKNGVISHGDSWTTNFMYKYENATKPTDAKLVDFQLVRCATPLLDVSFFIYACTSQELRMEYYESILKYYYDSLSNQIRALGTDPEKVYSWEVFREEVKKYSFYGLAFSFESTPFIVLDPEDAPSMEVEGDEKKNIDDFWTVKPIKTQKGRLREANNVVHCVDNGYI